MRKLAAAVAAAVAVLAMAALSGVALAGDHHGDHGSHHMKGQTSESAQQGSSSSSDSQAGVKPSNTTDKNTSCTTGGGSGSSATCHSDKSSKADASKRYGNGKTAAQIANGKGAPSGTPITGPGNSQPHKICGRDVHAYKGGDCSKQKHEQEQMPAKEQEQQVTFCDMESATSGKLETKSADEVAGHEFNGNPEENRDIVPPFTTSSGKTLSENWDANGQAIFHAGCNSASGVQGVKTTEQQQKPEGKVFICHATGSATNPFVLIHVNAEKAHLRHQGGRDVLLGANAGPCPTATQQQQLKAAAAATTATTTTTTPVTTTSTVAATTTVATTTTTAAAAAVTTAPTTTPSNTSGVQGASKTIAAPAASSTPSSGVLGTAKTLGRTATTGTLPFTGLRLWIVELIALGLIGGGVAMRLIARRRIN
jgi:hypothetical protein